MEEQAKMNLDFDKVVDVVTRVQKEAADIHLHPENHVSSTDLILKRGGADFTTQVDIAVEELKKRRLKEEFPDIGFLGEETDADMDGRYIWIDDPTDGTSVYSTAGLYYSTSTALADRKEKTVPFGSVYQPATGRQFLRLKEKVWVSEEVVLRDGKKERIERTPIPSVSAGAPELMGLAYGTSRHYHLMPGIKERLEHFFDPVEYPFLRRSYGMINARPASGSSALFCSDIADGNRHFAIIYFQKAWDLAVGALYARDAGCIVESGDTIQSLTGGNLENQIAKATKDTLVNVGVFANSQVRDIVLERLGSL
jgi:fructose-1,6-bisphosphatase/inositol monophosphatase family enzyme